MTSVGASEPHGRAELRRAADVVAFKDSQPFRRSVFADLCTHKPVIRAADRLYRALGPGRLSTAYTSLYALKSFLSTRLPVVGDRELLGAAMYRNERRQLDDLRRLIAHHELRFVDFGNTGLLDPQSWWALVKSTRRWASGLVVIREHNTGDFLVTARVASTVGHFLRFDGALDRFDVAAVVVSSDSNPYAMALQAAARRRGIPVIYVNHGHLPEGPPELDFELSVLDGEALLDVYRRSGAVRGEVVFRGGEGVYRPMKVSGLTGRRPTIGVFMSLVVDWTRFSRLFKRVRDALNPAQVIVRMHPNKTIRHPDAERWVRTLGDGVTVSDGERVLLQDAERCDLVIAGNSSCHLTVLKYGIPTLYLRGMDSVPHDFYRFVEFGVVCEQDEPRLRDIGAFYRDPEWARRFARFDASYPDRQDACDQSVRGAIDALVDRGGP